MLKGVVSSSPPLQMEAKRGEVMAGEIWARMDISPWLLVNTKTEATKDWIAGTRTWPWVQPMWKPRAETIAPISPALRMVSPSPCLEGAGT